MLAIEPNKAISQSARFIGENRSDPIVDKSEIVSLLHINSSLSDQHHFI